MILLDKCQIKSFEDINILIQVELFCLKTFFWKKLLEKKVKKLLFEKILEKIFFHLWRLKVQMHNRRGKVVDLEILHDRLI